MRQKLRSQPVRSRRPAAAKAVRPHRIRDGKGVSMWAVGNGKFLATQVAKITAELANDRAFQAIIRISSLGGPPRRVLGDFINLAALCISPTSDPVGRGGPGEGQKRVPRGVSRPRRRGKSPPSPQGAARWRVPPNPKRCPAAIRVCMSRGCSQGCSSHENPTPVRYFFGCIA